MKSFFDILIISLLSITALPAVVLLRHLIINKDCWEKRHKRITIAMASCLVLGFLLVFYGSFIESRLLYVRNTSIDLKAINKPIKIAFVADFQVGPYKREEYVQKVVDRILELKPDVILIGGDQVDNLASFIDESIYFKPMEELAKKIPTYAIHGNHEYGVSGGRSMYDEQYRQANMSEITADSLSKIGIHYLINDMEELEINGQKINLFGGDEYWAQKLDLSKLNNRSTSTPTIALIHNPMAITTVSGYRVELMLAGHTHGGQIRLPFIGPIKKVDKELPRAWHKGWVKYDGTDMFVTSGVGETGVRARLFNRPEIVLLELQ